MLGKKIEFTLIKPDLEDSAEFPSPAIKNLPDWYKSMSPYSGDKKENNVDNFNPTMKKCVPVIDAISNGYIIKTWTDVNFGENSVTWSLRESGLTAVEGHPLEQVPGYPIESFYKKDVFKWINPWQIKTPKGYSCMFVTPIGHHLPFKIIEGVVDTDRFPLTINFPFLIYKNFKGIIPHNTPMVQVIPFKRDSFNSKNTKFDENEYTRASHKHMRTFLNRYKINWWTRKDFK
jgi:hypothetical protein